MPALHNCHEDLSDSEVFSYITFVYITFEGTEPSWFICVHSAQEISTTHSLVSKLFLIEDTRLVEMSLGHCTCSVAWCSQAGACALA